MVKRIVTLLAMSIMLSGCFIAPMAFIGPVTSGFTTASIIQSTITTSAGYMVKKSTGKTIGQHAFDALSQDVLKQTYFPTQEEASLITAP